MAKEVVIAVIILFPTIIQSSVYVPPLDVPPFSEN